MEMGMESKVNSSQVALNRIRIRDRDRDRDREKNRIKWSRVESSSNEIRQSAERLDISTDLRHRRWQYL